MVIELKEWRATLSQVPHQRVVKYAGARSSTALLWLALSFIPSAAQMASDQIEYELSTRYAYADGAAVLDLGQITTKTVKARTTFDWSLLTYISRSIPVTLVAIGQWDGVTTSPEKTTG